MIKFAWTIVYVNDVQATISFYEKAFGFTRKFVPPGNEYAELSTGETVLSFAAISLAKKNLPDGFIASDPSQKPLGIELAFTTNEVDKQFQQAIDAGATSVAKPVVKPWGQTVGYVRDINGVLIEICTPTE